MTGDAELRWEILAYAVERRIGLDHVPMKMRVEHYPHPQGWDEGFYALVGSEDGLIHCAVTPPGQYVGHRTLSWEVREWVSDRRLSSDEDNHKTAVRMVQRHRERHPFTPTAITKAIRELAAQSVAEFEAR